MKTKKTDRCNWHILLFIFQVSSPPPRLFLRPATSSAVRLSPLPYLSPPLIFVIFSVVSNHGISRGCSFFGSVPLSPPPTIFETLCIVPPPIAFTTSSSSRFISPETPFFLTLSLPHSIMSCGKLRRAVTKKTQNLLLSFSLSPRIVPLPGASQKKIQTVSNTLFVRRFKRTNKKTNALQLARLTYTRSHLYGRPTLSDHLHTSRCNHYAHSFKWSCTLCGSLLFSLSPTPLWTLTVHHTLHTLSISLSLSSRYPPSPRYSLSPGLSPSLKHMTQQTPLSLSPHLKMQNPPRIRWCTRSVYHDTP
eukprot:Rhum_TRINITY_DN14180_c5_g2::Rhum_TRINITY_DN14180_c5_g2_i1::g.72644::m.72644